MDTNHTVASVKIGSWKVSIIECIDGHNGVVMDREFVCTKGDMIEPQHSLVEAVEFAQSVTGRKALNPWSYVETLSRKVIAYHAMQEIPS
jgi:hypothetical protein